MIFLSVFAVQGAIREADSAMVQGPITRVARRSRTEERELKAIMRIFAEDQEHVTVLLSRDVLTTLGAPQEYAVGMFAAAISD
jgi:hypothetical protein